MYDRQNFLTAALSSLLVLMLSVPVMAETSPITQTKDSSDFEWCYEFEGDTAALLDAIDLDENEASDFTGYHAYGVNSVHDGVISMSSTEWGGYNLFGVYGPAYYPLVDTTLWRNVGFDRTTGFTIEARIKITSSEGEGASGAFSIIAAPTDSQATGGINIASNGQSFVSPAVSIGDQEDNMDDFHTFRIALETNPSVNEETYSVWRDGVCISSGLSYNGGRTGMFMFGDAATAVFGSADIDYLRIGHGSWAPVPEPSSLILLLGILSMAVSCGRIR